MAIFSATVEKQRKVIAYVTRGKGGKRQLLVFTHHDYPEAGLQVPAGTVDAGESVEAALFREIEEESGISTGLRLVKLLAVYDWYNPETGIVNERHVFHVESTGYTPERWNWLESGGRLKPPADLGEPWHWPEAHKPFSPHLEGYVFQFEWRDLDGQIELAGEQGAWLSEIEA